MSILDQHAPDRAPHTPRTAPQVHRVRLRGGRAGACYRQRGRWAITPPGGVWADGDDRELALSAYLDVLRERRLRPLFTGLVEPLPYTRRGLAAHHYADDAVLGLTAADQPGSDAAAVLRRDLLAARAGLTVLPYHPRHRGAVATLIAGVPSEVVRAEPMPGGMVEMWVAVDASGVVCGVAAWDAGCGLDPGRGVVDRPGTGRSLCRVAASPHAPGSTVELLLLDAVAGFRTRGVTRLHLGRRARAPWWQAPGSQPSGRTWAALEGCGPRWCARWLALPSPWQLPAAARIVCRGGGI